MTEINLIIRNSKY